MSSRLIQALDVQIAAAQGTVAGDCMSARKALHLVRMGHAAPADEILKALHEKYDARPQACVSAWLHLVEGLACLYLGTPGRPEDRLKRALAISAAYGDSEMWALVSAWAAHLAYATYDVEALALRLGEVFQHASSSNHQALSRAKLIGAVALHLANRYDLARHWYADVRMHAAEEGDEATISALMHNIACMCVATLRQRTLDPNPSIAESAAAIGPGALLGATATASYDDLVGASGLSTWIPILQAQAHALQGHPEKSLEIYEANLIEASEQGLGRVMGYMMADIAWCRLQVGQRDRALADARTAEDSLRTSIVLVDDRAATHSRLAAVYSGGGLPEEAARHGKKAADEWVAFRRLQDSLVDSLSPLVTSVPRK